jgi:hypothetical protein
MQAIIWLHFIALWVFVFLYYRARKLLAVHRSYEQHAWCVVREIILHQLADTPITDCTIINSPANGLMVYIGDGERMVKLDMAAVQGQKKVLREVVDEGFNRWVSGSDDCWEQNV